MTTVILLAHPVNYLSGMKRTTLTGYCFAFLLAFPYLTTAQTNSTQEYRAKNIIRYNLSSPVLLGFDKTIILGYERALGMNRSFSVNFGTTALPRFRNLSSDSLQFSRNAKDAGYNFSADYRFYLGKLNAFPAMRGVYIGPYYSFNGWRRESDWKYASSGDFVNAKINFDLHMAGLQLGYQFIFYRRFTLDLVLIGPGVGFYKINTSTESNLTDEQLEQLHQAIIDKIQEKFPGFNYVFDGKALDSQGSLTTSSLGFRYIVHIGFAF